MSSKIKYRHFQLEEASTTEKACVVSSRILLLSFLTYKIYQSFAKTTLEGDDWDLLLNLSSVFSTINNLCLVCGQFSCLRYTERQASMSREECLNNLNTAFKSRSWFIRARVNGGESDEKNRERERFVRYLAGSYRGGAMVLHRYEASFQVLVFQALVILLMRFAIGAYLSMDITYTYKLIFWGFYFVLGIFAFGVGRYSVWYSMMGRAARTIKERCTNMDEENGGDAKETLDWWIGVFLEDEQEDVRCCVLGRSFLDFSKRSVLPPVSGSKTENRYHNDH